MYTINAHVEVRSHVALVHTGQLINETQHKTTSGDGNGLCEIEENRDKEIV